MDISVVRPPTLVAATQESIRDAIFRGDLRPGQPLRELDLSQSLRISRATIREALRGLEEEGLVAVIPHRGVFVVQLNPRIVREVYAVRSRLEPYAVRIALERQAYAAGDLQDLDALVRKMGALSRFGDDVELIKTDREFHYRICRPSDNQVLLHTLDNLRSLTILCLRHIRLYDPHSVPDELSHRHILDAILSADPALGEDATHRHLIDFGTRLVEQMTAIEAQPS